MTAETIRKENYHEKNKTDDNCISCLILHTIKINSITESAAFSSLLFSYRFEFCNGMSACFCNRIHYFQHIRQFLKALALLILRAFLV